MEETILLPTRTTPGIRRLASQTPMTRIVLSRFTPLKGPSISHFYRATSPPEPKSMANTRNLLSAAASLAASAVLARTIINDLLPHSVRHQFLSSLAGFFSRFSSELTIIIAEYNGFSCNDMYLAAETYLGTKVSPATRRLCVSKKDGEKHLEVTMERGEEVADVFEGVQFKWRLICRETQHEVAMPESYMRKATMSEARSLELTFNKKHKAKAMDAYLPYILAQAKVIKAQDRSLKIHTLRLDYHPGNIADIWCPINLDHPATFDTLAMEAQLKREVIEDLERFVRRKEYYKKVGKAWKRGYLLYGPPGTGKSSLIAAMANYLRFDVYDLELAAVQSNSLLRSLLVGTGNQSILVVEDIDCSIDLANRDGEEGEKPVRSRVVFGRFGHREEKVTLSGLLNFIDGLWSSCGDERIIVFTTNHKDRLDPALLRPGRMDMHIYMGYCGSDAFHTLLSNYHGVDATAHPRFNEIEGLLHDVQATPAEVAEELMKSDVADVALQGLVKFLQGKTREAASEQKDEGNIGAEGERKVDELVQVVDLS